LLCLASTTLCRKSRKLESDRGKNSEDEIARRGEKEKEERKEEKEKERERERERKRKKRQKEEEREKMRGSDRERERRKEKEKGEEQERICLSSSLPEERFARAVSEQVDTDDEPVALVLRLELLNHGRFLNALRRRKREIRYVYLFCVCVCV
jgi:hypothetical protein